MTKDCQSKVGAGVVEQYEDEARLHPVGSQARKLLYWAAIELPDRAERIAELEEDDDNRLKECEQLRQALCTIKAALEVVSNYARDQAFHLGFEGNTFARDFAPFINLMGIHHKDPDYGKPGKPTGHIDTKDLPRRKKKESS